MVSERDGMAGWCAQRELGREVASSAAAGRDARNETSLYHSATPSLPRKMYRFLVVVAFLSSSANGFGYLPDITGCPYSSVAETCCSYGAALDLSTDTYSSAQTFANCCIQGSDVEEDDCPDGWAYDGAAPQCCSEWNDLTYIDVCVTGGDSCSLETICGVDAGELRDGLSGAVHCILQSADLMEDSCPDSDGWFYQSVGTESDPLGQCLMMRPNPQCAGSLHCELGY